MNDKLLDEALEELTKQMIINKFENKEEKFIITKHELYLFCIKLIKELIKYEKGV